MRPSVFSNVSLEKSFEQDGIVSMPFLDEAELKALYAIYENNPLEAEGRNFHSTMFSSDPAYRKKIDVDIRAIILPKIKQVLNNYRLLFANFIVKNSSDETKVNIHQDWNFTSPDHVSVNIWIPLIDITVSTGLFYALKGSQRIFQNIRYTPMAPSTYADIENYIKDKSTPFQIKAGYALIYHGALVHFSEPNISGRTRIAVGAALIPADAPNLHYYKRGDKSEAIEIYQVDDNFYQGFDFYHEPEGVNKIGELASSPAPPSLNDLVRS